MPQELPNWDLLDFFYRLEQAFQVKFDINEIGTKSWNIATEIGKPNWFYYPDNYMMLFWNKIWFVKDKTPKPPITVGEWIQLAIEIVKGSVSTYLITPDDWPGIKASDLESDAIVQKCATYNTMCGSIIFVVFITLGTVLVRLIIYLVWNH